MSRTEKLRIFISYRRNESSGYSRLLFERLRAEIPQAEVFMDVEGIPLGGDWRTELAGHLDAANVVLVLVGRDWLTMTDERGHRRLDDPEDITRWEITRALDGGKRVVPVLLGDVPHLQEEMLPSPMAQLADLQAITISHEAFETGLDALIDHLTGRRLRDALRQEQGRRRLGQARQWTIPTIALLVFLLAWVSILDLFTLDTRAATWTLALADALAPPRLEAKIALVAIPDTVDPRVPGTRVMYGRLVDKLTAHGARAIVFDLYFHEPRPLDEALVQSFRNASAAGTDVFFGFTQLNGNKPRAVPSLAESASGVGLACVGRRLGYAVSMPIAFNIGKTDQPDKFIVSRLPSLALLGYSGPVSVSAVDTASSSLVLQSRDSVVTNTSFSLTDPVRQAQRGCPALKTQTTTASVLIRLSPPEVLRDSGRRLLLADVLADRAPRDAIAGRTVIVGYETKNEEFTIAYRLRQQKRYGYELHADAINTLETKRIAQPIGAYAQTLVMLIATVVGVWLGVKLRHRTPLLRRSVVGVLIASYALLAVLLAAGDLLLHITYDVAAFAAAYLVMHRLARKLLN